MSLFRPRDCSVSSMGWRKPALIRNISLGRRRTIRTGRPIAACARSKPRTPASSSAATRRSSRRSTGCAACARPRRRGCSSSSAHPAPENRRSCARACFRGLRAMTGNFLPLPIIRPERAAIYGETGLLAALEGAFAAAGIATTRANLRAAIEGGRATLRPLLQALADKATPSAPDADAKPKPPTLILSIDQGEELFLAEGAGRGQGLSRLAARPAHRRRARHHRRFHYPVGQLRTPATCHRTGRSCARKRSACRRCRRAPMPR